MPSSLGVFCASACAVSVLAGCSAFKPQPLERGIIISQAERPQETRTSKELRSLPPPSGKIVAAVYGFRDLTGQNKPAPASGFSTAVTQGAENILVKSLLESGWFTPVERGGLQNLLTERSLWEQQASNANQRASLPPLPPATVVFEGGIIAHETNLRTGGSGAKYLGIGASTTYREDSLTINMRVVNVVNGLILHSSNMSKRIFSKSVNYGLFGFVSYDQIAETEAGYAYNEPTQRGVEDAIQSALVDIIAQGVLAGTWDLKDPSDLTSESFSRFLTPTQLAEYLDANEVSSRKPAQSSDTDESISGLVGDRQENATPTSGVREADTSSRAAVAEEPENIEKANSIRGAVPVAKSEPVGIEPEKPTGASTARDAEVDSATRVLPVEERTTVSNKIGKRQRDQSSLSPSGDESSKKMNSELKPEKVPPETRRQDTPPPEQRQNEESVEHQNRNAVKGQRESKPAVNLYVNAGEDQKAAEDLYRKLYQTFNGVEIVLIENVDTGVYRVRIGPLFSAADAQLVITNLEKMGITKVRIEQLSL